MLACFAAPRSTMVLRVAYDAASRRLYVTFRSMGKTYCYAGCPPSDFWSLFFAECGEQSVGRQLHAFLRLRADSCGDTFR
jgi:hypothetical protein